MFNIRLFKFNKKSNSTKKPVLNTGQTFSCTMKTSSSIINPVIDIKYPSNQIPDFNYAYIDSFKRYYYVTDTEYSIGVWTLYLSVDVLATYKDDILNSSQYVLRSYSNYDGDLIDSIYDTKLLTTGKCSYSVYPGATVGGSTYTYGVNYRYSDGTSGTTSNYFNVGLSGGDFLVGIVGNNATGVNYYSMSYNTFKQFINQAVNLTPTDMTDVSTGVAQAIYNPIQYITVVRWYPEVPQGASDTAINTVYLGKDSITTSGSIYPLDIEKTVEYWMEIPIPRHPSSSSYPYLNQSPYSEYNLFFQPFGNIPIDATKIYGQSDLYVTWTVDFAKGVSHMRVRPYSHLENNAAVIIDTMAEYGVTIPISSLVMDVQSGLTIAGLTWLNDGIKNLTSSRKTGKSAKDNPQYRNAINAGVDMGRPLEISSGGTIERSLDALAGAMGQVKTSGTSGSFLAYNSGKPYVYAFFYDQTSHFPELFGRPSNKQLVLSGLTGFTLCENAALNYTYLYPTEGEKNAVIGYLDSGFFIE